MRRSDGGVGELGDRAAVERSLLIAVHPRGDRHADRCRTFIDGHDLDFTRLVRHGESSALRQAGHVPPGFLEELVAADDRHLERLVARRGPPLEQVVRGAADERERPEELGESAGVIVHSPDERALIDADRSRREQGSDPLDGGRSQLATSASAACMMKRNCVGTDGPMWEPSQAGSSKPFAGLA